MNSTGGLGVVSTAGSACFIMLPFRRGNLHFARRPPATLVYDQYGSATDPSLGCFGNLTGLRDGRSARVRFPGARVSDRPGHRADRLDHQVGLALLDVVPALLCDDVPS